VLPQAAVARRAAVRQVVASAALPVLPVLPRAAVAQRVAVLQVVAPAA